ncbi:hypothetical protein [Streptomyces aurantiacus]|uniref:hypothetical protein n=1 Tax=Streptomyces aurantiacus TaxID=47760 RepID=UPI0006E3652C|nr:hypothetical protein [Streptomyces aurantiacus]
MATEPELTPVVDFLSEHSPSKSCVMALIGPYHGSRSLTGVLTCKDKHHAYQAVQLLRRALAARDTAAVAEDLRALAAALPDAPAGSLRTATAHAASGTWPAPAGTTFCPPVENPREDGGTQGDEASAVSESATPHGARLKDLPGKVVRISHLREFHITDEDALIRAAMDADWDPLPSSELAEDDPRDLIGAVMTLTESGSWITGADTLEDQSEAGRLCRHRIGPGSVAGALTGVADGLATGLAWGFLQARYESFTLARWWLALRGQVPWRLMSFLADAHRRGVLRQVGATYQLRHAELQRRLAGRT